MRNTVSEEESGAFTSFTSTFLNRIQVIHGRCVASKNAPEPSSDAVFVTPYEFFNVTWNHPLIRSMHPVKLAFSILAHPLNIVCACLLGFWGWTNPLCNKDKYTLVYITLNVRLVKMLLNPLRMLCSFLQTDSLM